MSQAESRLSKNIQRELRKRGAFCFKVHGSEYQMAGLPDIVACYKGVFIGFETKMPSKRNNVSPIQAHVHAMIAASGGLIRVICSIDEALSLLDAIDEHDRRIAGELRVK